MFATWYTPVGFMLWGILVVNGFFTAINGPIMQSMPVLLPEIGDTTYFSRWAKLVTGGCAFVVVGGLLFDPFAHAIAARVTRP